MRAPDRETLLDWKDKVITVKVWVDPTDTEWDGDAPLDANAEGFDICVKVELNFGGHMFNAYDSLGSVWTIPGDKYVETVIGECTQEALATLQTEIEHVAKGRDVNLARKRQGVAKKLLAFGGCGCETPIVGVGKACDLHKQG